MSPDPAEPKGSPYPFARFAATQRVTHFAPSPDGSTLVVIGDMSGQYNLWRIPTAAGCPEQLTALEGQAPADAGWSPDGRWLFFQADPGGNEQFQLYQMEAGGWPEQLTENPEARHELGFDPVSPDGRYLAFASNDRRPTDYDVYLLDRESGTVHHVMGGGGLFFPAGFSPDGRRLLVYQVYGNTNHDIWLLDLADGGSRKLTDHPERPVKYDPVAWDPEGRGFYFLTNDGRELMAPAFYDLAAERWHYLVQPDWEVEHAALSGDGRWLAYVVNEAGSSILRVRDLRTGTDQPLPPLPRGVIHQVAFAPADPRRRVFLRVSSYRQSAALYAVDLDRQEVQLLLDGMLGRIPEEHFVEPELVYIPTFDRRQVPAWLYRPRGLEPGQRVPAVLSIHGGPETQERPEYRYHGLHQYLVSQGVAVLAPNIRGSTGFGISYQKLIHRDWGGGDLKDIEACARYLQSQPWVDPQRLGVWGRSYGGFATLSAVTRLPQYWAVGAEMVGPANLVSFVSSVPPHWRPMMKAWLGDPEEDRELLLERSPITYVENVRCPLLVIQGANDPRVVKSESDQVVARLRELGREVEYIVFENEGHEFAQRGNALRGYGAVAEFLVRHLKP